MVRKRRLLNKNRIFILFLISFSFLTFFLAFSFFAKYKASNEEQNLKQYKTLANCVAPTNVLKTALKKDIKFYEKNKKSIFVTLISLLAAKYYGDWNEYDEKDLNEFYDRLNSGEKENEISELYGEYDYFKSFYDILFCEFVGKYKTSKENKKSTFFEEKYGLKAFSPIAYGYATTFCDDFDGEINFAKQKGHFGNDIAVKKGTPFVAVESGVISSCVKNGKNSKLELKSFDGKRTYIYCNCNEKAPFKKGIEKGTIVAGGEILGFVGTSNCCNKGGAKILNCPYLHFAMKLTLPLKGQQTKDIEVFVDVYNILKFLEHHKSFVKKTKEGFITKHIFKDENFEKNSRSS